MNSTCATSIQPGANVVQLRPRDECPVSAALAELSAKVRRGEIVSLSVVMTDSDGIVSHVKLCSPKQRQ